MRLDPLYAIYPSRLHRAAKVRAFIEFCLEMMGANVGVRLRATERASRPTSGAQG
jgi:hypothetical protein